MLYNLKMGKCTQLGMKLHRSESNANPELYTIISKATQTPIHPELSQTPRTGKERLTLFQMDSSGTGFDTRCHSPLNALMSQLANPIIVSTNNKESG